jgi:C4-dicarboxylate-specific signal transduction histidine kinase
MLEDISILYVEDEKGILNIVSEFLSPLFKNFHTAQNGQEGLDIYNKHSNEIDLIVTDINMPVLNGLKMSQKIRESNPTIPIIIITAYNEKNFLHEAIKLGVRDFVLKPMDLKNLLESIKKSLEPVYLKKKLDAERKLHEEERIRNAKYTASGQLAAGLTHEINTPLTYIKANFEMIGYDLEDLPDSKPKSSIEQSISKISDGIKRIETIVHSIKEMSHENSETMEDVNIYTTIVTALTLSYNKIKHIAKIYINGEEFSLDTDKQKYKYISHVQKQRIEQVWLIIITNALDELVKIKEFENRRLDINISYEDDLIKIIFEDNAGGISEQILDNIFDPFKGTKNSSGVGVGLSIAKKIINDQNKGSIKAYNKNNHAVFEIQLPAKKDF